MKKISILALMLLMLAGLKVSSQSYLILARPVDSKDWGYYNLKGEAVIQPQFKNAIGFDESGLAAIYEPKAKEFYFIKANGEKLQTEVSGFKLMEIFGFGMKGFRDGMAPVKIDDKWGFLNTQGKLTVAATFDKVTQFNSGFASGQKGGKFYVIGKNGQETLIDIPGLADVTEFSEQLAVYKTPDDMVGYIDGAGKIVIPAKFKSAGDFTAGFAWAKDVTGSVGYIDTKGEFVVPPKFEAGKNFDPGTGLARVKLGGNWAYTDKTGNMTFVKDTEIWEDFFNGLARGKKGGLFGFYNAKGEWVIAPQFDGARDFNNGYASVKKGDKWGVIDTNGNWVIEPKFDEIKDVEIVK